MLSTWPQPESLGGGAVRHFPEQRGVELLNFERHLDDPLQLVTEHGVRHRQLDVFVHNFGQRRVELFINPRFHLIAANEFQRLADE